MRRLRRRLLAAPLLFAVPAAWMARAQPMPVRIALHARKFTFSQTEIRVKKGQPLTFVLTGDDFVHGFAVPDFKVRADVVPGKPAEVTFTPDKAGKFHFLCDNFCGEGHDRMSGFLIVGES